MGLSSAANVFNTCLRILRQRGYDLRMDGELWIATQNGFMFIADNPIELLGLAAIYEYVKPAEDIPYWWNVPGADILGELLADDPDELDRSSGIA